MTSETFPFGYEYEVILSPVRRLFGYDDRLVFESDRGGRAYLIEDFGVKADFNAPEFEDTMDEMVTVLGFASVEEREGYLEARYVAERPWLRGRIDEARADGGDGDG